MSDPSATALPKKWEAVPLGDLLDEPAEQTGPESHRETFVYVDIGSVDNSEKRIVERKEVPVVAAPSRARQLLRKDDVLVSMTRPNLNAVARVTKEFDGAVGSTGFFVLRSRAIFPKWIFYAVQTQSFVSAMSRVVQGALYPAVRPRDIARWVCPVPPKEEQARIADALDEILSDLDAGVAALERVRTKLKHYRAAVLKAAVEGALTAEWRREHPATETADALLTRILAERRRRWEEAQLAKFAAAGKSPPKDWTAKYIDPVNPELNIAPMFPKSWSVTSMDGLTSRITSGSRDWQRFYGRGSGTFIMAQNVRPALLDMSFRQAVDPPQSDSSCERSLVYRDDLLVTIVGANTGDVCRVPDELEEHYVCQSVALMRPVEPTTASFLDIYFNSIAGGQLHFQRYLYGAGRPHLSFDQLKMTPVALPPLDEQRAIVEAAESQLTVIDHLESDIDSRLNATQALRQSILRYAFTGQLVPQDPNDEPASELLKRIAAEREERARLSKAAKQAIPGIRTARARARKQ